MRLLLVCRASRLLFGSIAQPAAIDEQPVRVQAAEKAELSQRCAASGPGWSEVFISPALASRTRSPADAVASGFSLLLLHELAVSLLRPPSRIRLRRRRRRRMAMA